MNRHFGVGLLIGGPTIFCKGVRNNFMSSLSRLPDPGLMIFMLLRASMYWENLNV